MSTMRHHCMVVTCSLSKEAREAHTKAIEIMGKDFVTEMLFTVTNGYYTFFVGPDGSKEGWEECEKGAENRAKLVLWLGQQSDDNGCSGSVYSWALVQYGDDDGEQRLVLASDLQENT